MCIARSWWTPRSDCAWYSQIAWRRQGARALTHPEGRCRDSSSFLQQIDHLLGPSRISKLALETATNKQLKIVHGMSSAASVPLPVGVTPVPGAPKNQHKTIACASQFRMKPGLFVGADGKPLEILTSVSANSPPGVVLIDPHDAAPWIQARKVVTHELVLCVLGTCGDTNCPSVHLAAFSGDDPVVLRVCIHQAGGSIACRAEKSRDLKLPPSCVLSFSVFRDEWATQEWENIKQHPIRVMMDQFESINLLAAPWSRQWGLQGRKADVANAERFSFVARIDQSEVVRVFQQSGLNKVYVSPLRSGPDKPSTQFQVIWIGESHSAAVQQTRLLVEQHGLKRSYRRGFGVRVKASDFASIFTRIKPGVDLPDLNGGSLMFRVQPIPASLSVQALREWLVSCKWKAAPVRQQGGSWLISSDTAPSEQFLPLGDGHVLVRDITKHSARVQPTVAAGVTTHASGLDPLQVNDPWSRPSSVAKTPVPADQARLDRQDKQILELKKAVTDLKDTQAAQSTVHDSFRSGLVSDQKFRTEIHSEVQGSMKTFEHSLMETLRKQQRTMEGDMTEIKSMLKALHSGHSSKKPRRHSDKSDMDDD